MRFWFRYPTWSHAHDLRDWWNVAWAIALGGLMVVVAIGGMVGWIVKQ